MGHSFFNYRRGMEPVPGYLLVDRLGEGGFGEVWRASAPGHIPCALKIIDLTGQEGSLEFRSLRLVKSIDHANVNPITGIWIKDDTGRTLDDSQWNDDGMPVAGAEAAGARNVELIIAMRLCSMSLHKLLQEYKKQGLGGIARQELLVYMDDAARAIDYLNQSKSIIHCDIKPQNILVSGRSGAEPGTASICDFGLARMVENLQKTREAPVTVFYAAPEAFKGKARAYSDQYSLAIAYFELRCGGLPFAKESLGNFFDIYEAHREGKLDLSLLEGPEREVIARATSLDPQQRFKNCREMVTRLREAVEKSGPLEPIPELAISEPPAIDEAALRTPGGSNAETSFNPGSDPRGSGRGQPASPSALTRVGDATSFRDLSQTTDSGVPVGARTTPASALTAVPGAASDSGPKTQLPLARTTVEAGRLQDSPSAPRAPQTLASQVVEEAPPVVSAGEGGARGGNRGLVAGIVVLLGALLLGGGYLYMHRGQGTAKGPVRSGDEIRRLIDAGDLSGAASALRDSSGRLPSAQEEPLWDTIEERWKAVAQAVQDDPDPKAADQAYQVGRDLNRASLSAPLLEVYKQRVTKRVQMGDFSGAKSLLQGSGDKNPGNLSQADIARVQDELCREWLAGQPKRFSLERYEHAASFGLFVQELQPDDHAARLWVARSRFHDKKETKAREDLRQIVADKLPDGAAKTLYAVLSRLAGGEGSGSLAPLLAETAAVGKDSPWALDDWERERLAELVASQGKQLLGKAREFLSAENAAGAQNILSEIAEYKLASPAVDLLKADALLLAKRWADAEKLLSGMPKPAAPELAQGQEARAALARLELAASSGGDLAGAMTAAAALAPKLDKAAEQKAQLQSRVTALKVGLLAALRRQFSGAQPESESLAAQLAAGLMLAEGAENYLIGWAMEKGVLRDEPQSAARLKAAAAQGGRDADYLNFVLASRLAAQSPPSWPEVIAALRAVPVAPGGSGGEWLTPPRRANYVGLVKQALNELAKQRLGADGGEFRWLAADYSPFATPDAALAVGALWKRAGLLSTPPDSARKDLSPEAGILLLAADPKDAIAATAVLADLGKKERSAGERLWLRTGQVLSAVQTAKDDAQREGVLPEGASLVSDLLKQFPDPKQPAHAKSAALVFSQVATPILMGAGRPKMGAAVTVGQKNFAAAVGDAFWPYFSAAEFSPVVKAGGLEPLLSVAVADAQGRAQDYLRRALVRLEKAQADAAGARDDAHRAAELSGSDPKLSAQAAAAELAAVARLPSIPADQQAAIEASILAVEAAVGAGHLPGGDFTLVDVWKQVGAVRKRTAGGNFAPAIAALEKGLAAAGGPESKSAMGLLLRTEIADCRWRALRAKHPGGPGQDAAARQEWTALRDAVAGIARVEVSPPLVEPQLLLARVLADDAGSQPQAHQAYFAAASAAVDGSPLQMLALREWAMAPLLPNPADAKKEGAPAAAEIEKLLEKRPAEAKQVLRLIVAKSYLRRVTPLDTVQGEEIAGDFKAADNYLGGYKSSAKLDEVGLEWLRLRLAVHWQQMLAKKEEDVPLWRQVMSDADQVVSSQTAGDAIKAFAFAARGTASFRLGESEGRSEYTSSAAKDYHLALQYQPQPPTYWRIQYCQYFVRANEGKNVSTQEKSAVAAQADAAIAELKKIDPQGYATTITRLEQLKDRLDKLRK